MVDLPDAKVDLLNTLVDLPKTMVDLPYTMVHGLPFIFLYLANGSGTTRSPGLVFNQTLNGLPGHGLSDSRL